MEKQRGTVGQLVTDELPVIRPELENLNALDAQ
jgi:hypothetical protein